MNIKSHKAYIIVYFFIKCLGILTRSWGSSPIVFIQVVTSSNDADRIKNKISDTSAHNSKYQSHFHQNVNTSVEKNTSLIKRMWTLSRLSSHSAMKNLQRCPLNTDDVSQGVIITAAHHLTLSGLSASVADTFIFHLRESWFFCHWHVVLLSGRGGSSPSNVAFISALAPYCLAANFPTAGRF